nr:hypothetical protein GCM10020092_003270 [Actinoplanes digitatis]
MARPGLPKLIATDLDGTLVRSDDTVSAYTHEVLDRVRAAGIRLVAATGRGPPADPAYPRGHPQRRLPRAGTGRLGDRPG